MQIPESVLHPLPAHLQSICLDHWSTYLNAAQGAQVPVLAEPALLASVPAVWAASDFVARACARDPAMLADLAACGELGHGPLGADGYRERVRVALADAVDEDTLRAALRRLRRREMVRIAWRDLAGWAGLEETLHDLSDLAEACIDGALAHLDAWQRADWGVPRSRKGTEQCLVVLAMGKLGAHELNFSSDIDLIFAYPRDGEVDGRRAKANSEYFTRLGHRLINVLDQVTPDGFVFRVDMRLRPYGESGPLVMSFDGMETYYQTIGREWERYAMIKARPVAGDKAAGEELMTMLRPFVYRRYLDFGAFDALREMKALIQREVDNKGMKDNIKLGPGGIREVEFIAQAFQLIRGGRERALQERRLLRVLEVLAARRHMPGYVVAELTAAYQFLRRTENHLQAMADRQTQELPATEEERLRLAFSMGFAHWHDFMDELAVHRANVEQHFEQTFVAPQSEDQSAPEGPDLVGIWHGTVAADRALEQLRANGFEDPDEVYRRLNALRESRLSQSLSKNGRQRLDKLMPLLMRAAGGRSNASECFARLVRLIEAVARRSVYLALLIENSTALGQLVRLASVSPWIADHLSKHPILMDELLDPRSLYAPLPKTELVQELAARLANVNTGDIEQEMEILRQFKQANGLRVAAAEVVGAKPLMKVSDSLTDIAETVLQGVVDLAWRDMAQRYGEPRCEVHGEVFEPGFAVIGYGKLGGLELNYGSDLDLVFLHNSAGDREETTGPRSIDNATFFARLGQRVMHYLNTPTPAGVLYEVDMRLRPSGNSGLLVSSIESFAEYQRSAAWTWEHQALVRARWVAGDPAIAVRFEQLRRETLTRPRDRQTLRQEVIDMRRRMREELGSKRAAVFDLKQDPGGIVDIEFLVQYGVLAWSAAYPDLAVYTDNVRILAGFARDGLLPAAQTALLTEAYLAFGSRSHDLALQEQKAVVGAEEFRDLREQVTAVWRQVMEA